MATLSVEDVRKFSRYFLETSMKKFEKFSEDMSKLRTRWDERNLITRRLESEYGCTQYGPHYNTEIQKRIYDRLIPQQKQEAEDLTKEWASRVEADRETLKKLKPRFAGITDTLYTFYKTLPANMRRYFNEVDTENIKQKFANLIMAFSFHHHMTIKADYDVMEWIGFKYDKGWHYNGINYGS